MGRLLYVFQNPMNHIREERVVPGENPHMHKENMQTQPGMVQGPGFDPATFLLGRTSFSNLATIFLFDSDTE